MRYWPGWHVMTCDDVSSVRSRAGDAVTSQWPGRVCGKRGIDIGKWKVTKPVPTVSLRPLHASLLSLASLAECNCINCIQHHPVFCSGLVSVSHSSPHDKWEKCIAFDHHQILQHYDSSNTLNCNHHTLSLLLVCSRFWTGHSMSLKVKIVESLHCLARIMAAPLLHLNPPMTTNRDSLKMLLHNCILWYAMAWLLCLMLGGHLPGEGSCEPGLALWPGLARRGWCRARAGAQLWLCVSVSQRQDTEYHQPSLPSSCQWKW